MRCFDKVFSRSINSFYGCCIIITPAIAIVSVRRSVYNIIFRYVIITIGTFLSDHYFYVYACAWECLRVCVCVVCVWCMCVYYNNYYFIAFAKMVHALIETRKKTIKTKLHCCTYSRYDIIIHNFYIDGYRCSKNHSFRKSFQMAVKFAEYSYTYL